MFLLATSCICPHYQLCLWKVCDSSLQEASPLPKAVFENLRGFSFSLFSWNFNLLKKFLFVFNFHFPGKLSYFFFFHFPEMMSFPLLQSFPQVTVIWASFPQIFAFVSQLQCNEMPSSKCFELKLSFRVISHVTHSVIYYHIIYPRKWMHCNLLIITCNLTNIAKTTWKWKWMWSRSVLSDSLRPHGL